jgi:hypothetical protein
MREGRGGLTRMTFFIPRSDVPFTSRPASADVPFISVNNEEIPYDTFL